jgi:hypothetical protein
MKEKLFTISEIFTFAGWHHNRRCLWCRLDKVFIAIVGIAAAENYARTMSLWIADTR